MNYKDPQLSQYTGTGNLGRDCELTYTPNTTAVVNNSMAVTCGYGEKKQTLWVNFAVFGAAAERMQDWKKGTRVMVGGRLEPDNYEGKEGFKLVANFVQDMTWPDDQ